MASADHGRSRFFADAESADRSARRRLAVLLILSFVWYALLTVDGLVANRLEYWLAAAMTLIFYPFAVLAIASMLRHPAPPWLMALPFDLLQKATPIVLVGVALAMLIQAPGALDPKLPVGNDISASVICASRAVLHGHDPYQESEVTCLRTLHAPIALGTPLQRGVFAHQRTYPTPAQLTKAAVRAESHGGRSKAFATFGYLPMSFLWMLPVAAGNHQAWTAYTMLAALTWLVIAGVGAGPLWPALVLVLMAQVGDGGLMAAAAHGDGEFFAYASVVLALIWLDRRRTSGILMGLGMAWHPLVWVTWFGYAIFTKRLPGFGQRMLWSVAAAVGLTVPWLLLEPGAVASVLGLIFQPNYPAGAGLVLLLGAHPDPLLRHLLLGLVVVCFAAFCGFAWRREQWRAALPVVGLAFLWLGWRSDVSYLSEVFPLAAAMTVGVRRLHGSYGPAALESDHRAATKRPDGLLSRLLLSRWLVYRPPWSSLWPPPVRSAFKSVGLSTPGLVLSRRPEPPPSYPTADVARPAVASMGRWPDSVAVVGLRHRGTGSRADLASCSAAACSLHRLWSKIRAGSGAGGHTPFEPTACATVSIGLEANVFPRGASRCSRV